MSNCIYVGDYDPPEVYSQVLRRARREHTCCECGETITPGDLYEVAKGKWDGDWNEYKTCARCVNVRTDYFRGWFFGLMVEDFEATHGFDYRDGIPADFTPCGTKERS